MSTMLADPMTLSETDRCQAREASEHIMRLLESNKSQISIRLENGNCEGEAMVIPRPALQFLVGALEQMSQGNVVTVHALPPELITRQAADVLHVSSAFLEKLLDVKKIPFRMDGTQRRIRLDDLTAYKRQDEERQHQIADALVADAQELGMGY